MAQFDTGAATGTYSYSFQGVDLGSYLLMAGSDMDNDGFICDAGEACGAFPASSLPELVTVDRDRSDLDFVTAFDAAIRAQDPARTVLHEGQLQGLARRDSRPDDRAKRFNRR